MTRRKLGRMKVAEPDAETSQKYFRGISGRDLHENPDSLSRFTSRDLFGNARPLEMEIGCGSGEFLCSLANKSPKTNFVGIDLHAKSLFKAVEMASASDLENILFVSADFRQAYPLFEPDSLQAVYLHFPDPGMKSREKRRRIFDERFLREMSRAALPGGEMSLVTDDTGYFQAMRILIEGQETWTRTHEKPHLSGFEPKTKSRFQKMWEKRGREVFRFELVNQKVPEPR